MVVLTVHCRGGVAVSQITKVEPLKENSRYAKAPLPPSNGVTFKVKVEIKKDVRGEKINLPTNCNTLIQ